MSDKNNDLNQLSLADLMAQLDQIVAWFSNGDIDIDEAIAKFDQGAKLAAVIKQKLSDTETKVNQIKLKLEKIEQDEA